MVVTYAWSHTYLNINIEKLFSESTELVYYIYPLGFCAYTGKALYNIQHDLCWKTLQGLQHKVQYSLKITKCIVHYSWCIHVRCRHELQHTPTVYMQIKFLTSYQSHTFCFKSFRQPSTHSAWYHFLHQSQAAIASPVSGPLKVQ